MKMKKSWLMVLAAVAAFYSDQTLRAITFGELDNGRHPNVGAVMVKVPGVADPVQFLSGTLIRPNLFLTAGHGTSELEFLFDREWLSTSDIFVTFADDPYDQRFYLPVARVITHPGYRPAVYDVAEDVWADAHGQGSIPIDDMGLLVLKKPSRIEPAALPPVGFLDELKRAGQLQPDTKILAVGYGSHATFRPSTPVFEPHNRELVFSEYRGFNDTCLTVSMNQVLGNGGGGYHDSGGPRFWVDPADGSEHLVSITERGDPNLVELDVTYRLDTAPALDFIEAVAEANP
jgi:hypothetical protein